MNRAILICAFMFTISAFAQINDYELIDHTPKKPVKIETQGKEQQKSKAKKSSQKSKNKSLPSDRK